MTDREMLELAARAVAYNPDTGSLQWLPKPSSEKDAARWNARYAGSECGTVDDKGYRRILMRTPSGAAFRVRAHRLAWYIAHGQEPINEIDHINQDKADNRLAKLRDVPKFVNQRNGTRKGNNTSGMPGVNWHKQRKKWCAQVSIDGKHHHLGLFDDPKEAGLVARSFRASHVFTENHGRVIRAAAEIGRAIK